MKSRTQFSISQLPVRTKRKFPTLKQWQHFFRVLSKKEKVFFFLCVFIFLVSLFLILNNFYLSHTKIIPTSGGEYKEGIVGQPRFINPIYANSEADRSLSQLIFSGLMGYDENMKVIPELAERYEISPDKKNYTFYLKKNLFWQDKQPLTVDDVIFTIKTIQNPETKSPLRANWVGVKVEKIDDYTVKFSLQKPYSAFLENCTLKIIPKHIWKDVLPKNIPLEITRNLHPIGSGPYEIEKIEKDDSGYIKFITLKPNDFYFGKKPYISKIKFIFFENNQNLIKAAERHQIDGISLDSFNQMKRDNYFQEYLFSFPRYFAVFFNQERDKTLNQKEVRLALNYATDKKEIVEKVLGLDSNSPEVEKQVCHSPILSKIYGFKEPSKIYNFDIQKAIDILEKAGFKKNSEGIMEKDVEKEPSFVFKNKLEKGARGEEVKELQKCLSQFPDIYPEKEISGYFGEKTKEAVIKFQEKYASEILKPWGFSEGTGIVSKTTIKKLNEICFPVKKESYILKFKLVSVDQPQLIKVAELLKEQWSKIGVSLEIEKYPLSELEQDFIKPRNYQILLLGEVLGSIPDPLPFWHSSQKIDPGLNLSVYSNKKADKLLEEIRETYDPFLRQEKLEKFQDILIEDAPAIFLYSPNYIYLITKKVKGVQVKKITEPARRFTGIENWYIKTKRVWK